MPEVEESVVIDRPRDQVFAFATDPTNVPLYNSNLIEFERLTPGPLKKGSQDRGAIKVAGKRMDWTAEAVEFEEGRRVAFRSIEAPVPFELEMTYEDVGDGTKVTWHQESDSFGGFFGKLADPLVTRMYAKDLRSNLENLKELLEAE